MYISGNIKTIELACIDSTNDFLKKYRPEQEDDVTLVTAECQTAGRGQRGNSWESEEGKNLIYSILIHPRCVRPAQIFSISEIAALSVCEALKEVLYTELDKKASCLNDKDIHTNNAQQQIDSRSHFSVKWPNDIYYGDKKIAGILIETDLLGKSIENAIIGVGVNINQQVFLSDAPNPISLFQIIGHEIERDQAMERIMTNFHKLYKELKEGDLEEIHNRFKGNLFRKEGLHPYHDKNDRFEARIQDIEPTGHIILEDSTGQLRRYAFKEVRFII